MEKTNFEKENDKNDIALFRFAIIAPLINNSCEYKSKEEFFRNAALKKYILPNGNEITVNPGTIKKWYLDYCKDGFECLKPKSRKDTGCSRTVPIECIEFSTCFEASNKDLWRSKKNFCRQWNSL